MAMTLVSGFSQSPRRWLRILSSPAVPFFTLPWLMVLLTAGTIAQKELGLYTAQHLYFSSWIFWLGPLPLPGGYMALGALTLSLLVKFLFFSPWRWSQAGIILSHFGILVLLIGGLVTAITQKEGFIILSEGQDSRAVQDYHQRVLRVEKDGGVLDEIPFEALKKNTALPIADLPFDVRVDQICKNCRPAKPPQKENLFGIAQQISLASKDPEKEDEANLSGVTLSITGLPNDQNGIYITLEEIPHKPSVDVNGHRYSFYMTRESQPLPFTIELKDFKRDMHPGTDTARGFSSDIVVHDGTISWPFLIRMNEPLRYKGYTLYQASFSMRPDGEYSILSVVQNKGRIFPYIASVILFAGLLLHVLIRLTKAKGAAQ